MFNFTFDRKTMYTILAVLMIIGILEYIMVPGKLLSLLISIPGVLIAITFHEFAHAFVSDKLGDDTPRRQGRFTLNPLAHIDPIGFFMLIVADFGWGKPVEINPRNFNRKMSMSAQEALVAVAGPVMNIIIAFILTIILFAIATFSGTFIFKTAGSFLVIAVQMAISVNIGLGVFNLIPVPPLDGSKILMHILPTNAKNWVIEHQNIFYIVFLILWITDLVSYIISPVINVVSSGIYGLVSLIFKAFM